jgi:hypothetical protein
MPEDRPSTHPNSTSITPDAVAPLAPSSFGAWLMLFALAIICFLGVWWLLVIAADSWHLVSLFTNDHLIQGSLADPRVSGTIGLALIITLLGVAACWRPVHHLYRRLPRCIHHLLTALSLLGALVSGVALCLVVLLVLMFLTPPARVSVVVAGYRIHLTERASRDLDFTDLDLIVTRADGAFYERTLTYATDTICTELVREQHANQVQLRCRTSRSPAVTITVDVSQQTLSIATIDETSTILLVNLPFQEP